MKKSRKHLELQSDSNKKKWKDECDDCKQYKYDVHGYYDTFDKPHILCPECLKKNKLVVLDWQRKPINREEIKYEKESNQEKRTRKCSKSNKDTTNNENVSEDKGELLHSGVSRRKSSTKCTKYRPGTRKISLI